MPFGEPPEGELGEPSHRKENLHREQPTARYPAAPAQNDQPRFQPQPQSGRPPTTQSESRHRLRLEEHQPPEDETGRVEPLTQGMESVDDYEYYTPEQPETLDPLNLPVYEEENVRGMHARTTQKLSDTWASTTRIAPDQLSTHSKWSTKRTQPWWRANHTTTRVHRFPGGSYHTTSKSLGITGREDKRVWVSRDGNVEGHGVTKASDVITGLADADEGTAHVSSDSDGQQGTKLKPEERAWTKAVLHMFSQTGKIHTTSAKMKSTSVPSHVYHTPAARTTMDPRSRTVPRHSEQAQLQTLPPLAPLTTPKPGSKTSVKHDEYNHETVAPNNDQRSDEPQSGLYRQAYHVEGGMEQYYKDYKGETEEETSQAQPENVPSWNTGSSHNSSSAQRPEPKQAPAYDLYRNGEFGHSTANVPSSRLGPGSAEPRLAAACVRMSPPCPIVRRALFPHCEQKTRGASFYVFFVCHCLSGTSTP